MDEQTNTTRNDLAILAEGASALITATADVTGKKVAEVRKHLSSVAENAKEMAKCVGEKAAEYAKVTDEAVREYPYQAIGVALGMGALLGCILLRRSGSPHTD